MSCSICGKLFDHKDSCPKNKKAFIAERDWVGSIPPRRIPAQRVQQALDDAPATSAGTSHKYPKKHKNLERYYPPMQEGDQYYEYVHNHDRPHYDYASQTNNKHNRLDPGYGRIITKSDKTLLGLSHHPPDNKTKLDRVNEIVGSRVPGVYKEVTYPENSDGKPQTIKHMARKTYR